MSVDVEPLPVELEAHVHGWRGGGCRCGRVQCWGVTRTAADIGTPRVARCPEPAEARTVVPGAIGQEHGEFCRRHWKVANAQRRDEDRNA